MALRVTTRFDQRKLRQKAQQGGIKSLGHAAAKLRLRAKRLIGPPALKAAPRPPGSPPRTRTKRLPKAILYAIDKPRQMAVIGTSRPLIGIAGAEHEHGEKFRGQRLPKRPFMAPALEQIAPELPRSWGGAIG